MSERTATKFITQIIAGHQSDDAHMIAQAIDDAQAAGYSVTDLLVILAGGMAGLLSDQGIGVEDSRALLVSLADAEADHD